MKILAIAPYRGLKRSLIEIGEEKEFNLTVEIADLNEAVQYAKKAEENGTDIIISRGGTAELLQKIVGIPVIEIEVSGYDILRVITLSKDFNGNVAIVGFQNVVEGAQSICDLLNININSFTISSSTEVREKLKELLQQGYDAIVGDVITVKIAEELGINGILLTSGQESVRKAFEEAYRTYNYISGVKKSLGHADRILNSMNQDIIAFNESGGMIYSNSTHASKLIKALEKNFGTIAEAVNTVKRSSEKTLLIEDGTHYFSCEGFLTNEDSQTGSIVLVFHVLEKKNVTPGINILTDHITRTTLYSPNSTKMKDVLKKLNAHFDEERALFVQGENGTGKETLIKYNYFNSQMYNSVLIIVDCEVISETEFSQLWHPELEKSPFLPYVRHVFFYLKKIESLSENSQKELLIWLSRPSKKRKFISSSSLSKNKLLKQYNLNESLLEYLSQSYILIPPLRERKEDIESMVSLFINEYNVAYGKQVSGLRKEALNELQSLQLFNNIIELKKLIENCVISSESSYIELEDIRKAIDSETPGNDANMDLSGTLEEIEYRIILKIWLEEGKNQSKTADRLGINRTTLWRKLKQSNKKASN